MLEMRNFVNQTPITRQLTREEFEEEQFSDGYAAYIMENAGGSRVICNGDTLLEAMEQGYLFDDYLMENGMEYVE